MNIVAEQDLAQFPDEVVCKINDMKFDGRPPSLQKMCFTIESFMVRMCKNHDVVKSVMEEYSKAHEAIYHMPFCF